MCSQGARGRGPHRGSEVGESSIRRAQAVCPISVAEIEFSLWSTEMLTNGVAAVCKELDIPRLMRLWAMDS